jgi:hypothetical protein
MLFLHGLLVIYVSMGALSSTRKPRTHCMILYPIVLFPYTDFKPFIMKYIIKRWHDSWDQQIHNKLHEIHSIVARLLVYNRKEQVVLSRCRIGHGRLTHSYLLNNEERPECISNFSLKHVLIDCVDIADVRKTFYDVNNLYDLFTNFAGDTNLKFLKEINVYTKI